jgi:hypothetical protein
VTADLEAVEARLDAATPGPWECNGDGEAAGHTLTIYGRDRGRWVAHVPNRDLNNNADLIANAPADLRALLAEVRTLRAERDAAREVVEAAEVVAHAFSLDGKDDKEREAAWSDLRRALNRLDGPCSGCDSDLHGHAPIRGWEDMEPGDHLGAE